MDDLNFAQHSIARAASRLGRISGDNGDGTYSVELSAGGGDVTTVASGNIGAFFPEGVWVTLERAGPGWHVAGYAPYQGGDEEFL